MNREQNDLVVFEEELGELAVEILLLQKVVSKTIRFGIDEQRDLPKSNRQRLNDEWNDVLGSIKNLRKHGLFLETDIDEVDNKVFKIEKFTTYSKKLDRVND